MIGNSPLSLTATSRNDNYLILFRSSCGPLLIPFNILATEGLIFSEEIVPGIEEGLFYTINGSSLKSDHIPQTDDLAVKDVRLIVKFDLCNPYTAPWFDTSFQQKLRTEFTAPPVRLFLRVRPVKHSSHAIQKKAA